MKRRPRIPVVIVGLCAVLLMHGCSRDTKPSVGPVRQPAVAGTFYPAKPDELKKLVREFLNSSKKIEVNGDLIALLSPHAGYMYSGRVAAHAFKVLEGTHWDTIVIIGASHRPSPYVQTGGFGIVPEGSFDTPLGRVEIDSRVTQALLKAGGLFSSDSISHSQEHSIETQLPFLQVILKDFKFVPILVGKTTYGDLERGAAILGGVLKGRTALLIASSDLSHYPSADDARRTDAAVLSALGSLNPRLFSDTCTLSVNKGVPGLEVAACGEEAILLTLLTAVALGADESSLLAYANSFDSGGEKKRTVGYGAMAFFRGRRDIFVPIGSEGRKELLTLVRGALTASLGGKKIAPTKPKDDNLSRPLGVFVTLKKGGKLRGCVGDISGEIPLYESVQRMAVAAATQDPRFPPVTKDELKDITIEVSVLSPLGRIYDVGKISLGIHGVLIRKEGHSGLFLPQVATETGWNMQNFLDELCTQKAGLSAGCWKGKDAEIYTFTAQVFGE